MRRLLWLVLAGLVPLSHAPAIADDTIPGECLIAVKGRTYRDGPCRISLQTDGSFQAGGGRRGEYFATVDVDTASGGGRANWNGPSAEGHAHDPLGPVVRQGGCWVNDKARVCAWRAGTRPKAEMPRPIVANGSGKIDVPIVIGGNTKFDACTGAGNIVGLDPKGDGFLSVRSGPGGRPYSELDRLYNGNEVAVCEERSPWLGVVYGPRSMDCNTSTPWPTRQPYTGPCKAGWVHRNYVKITAG